MSITVERVSAAQAERVAKIEEGQFSDVKAIDIAPAKLTKTISAFANSDGGDLLHFARFPHTRMPKSPRKTRGVPNNARFEGSKEPPASPRNRENPWKTAGSSHEEIAQSAGFIRRGR